MPAVSEQMYGAPQATAHLWQFNPNPRTLTWERLENNRLKQLGLGSKRYSRHFSRFQQSREQTIMSEPGVTVWKPEQKGSTGGTFVVLSQGKGNNNSIAPFYTQEKPTCGFYFSRGTDNRKRKFGIPPSDLVKWRSVQ